MGMFSEIAASNEAKRLEKVLIAALEHDRVPDVVCFAREHIWPLYKSAKDEAYEPIDAALEGAYK